jgi:hypothetical protein
VATLERGWINTGAGVRADHLVLREECEEASGQRRVLLEERVQVGRLENHHDSRV